MGFSSFLVTHIFHLNIISKLFSFKIMPAWSCPRLHNCCGESEGWDPVNWFNHTAGVAIVTPTDRPKSVRNRCVIEVFGGVFVLSRCFLDFCLGVGAFVIGLSQIFFFSLQRMMDIFFFKKMLNGQDGIFMLIPKCNIALVCLYSPFVSFYMCMDLLRGGQNLLICITWSAVGKVSGKQVKSISHIVLLGTSKFLYHALWIQKVVSSLAIISILLVPTELWLTIWRVRGLLSGNCLLYCPNRIHWCKAHVGTIGYLHPNMAACKKFLCFNIHE